MEDMLIITSPSMVMEKVTITENLLPWLICSSFSLQFDASIAEDRILNSKLFVESKSGDWGITADNRTDNYDPTKRSGVENNIFPEEEPMHNGEEWFEDGDEADDIGQQESSDSGDDNQDDDDDDDDDSNEYNEDNGDESDESDDFEEEEKDGDDDEKTESSPEQDELAKRVDVLDALELRISQMNRDRLQLVNDFWRKILERRGVLLRRKHAVCTYIGLVNDGLKSVNTTPTSLTLEVSITQVDISFFENFSRVLLQNDEDEVEAQEERIVANFITRGRTIKEQLVRAHAAEILITRNLKLSQTNTRKYNYICQFVEGIMVRCEKGLDAVSTLLSTKSNDLRRKGYEIPLWKDDFLIPSNSEDVPNVVDKDSDTLSTSPSNAAGNPSSS